MTNRFKAARQNTEFTHNDVNSDVKEKIDQPSKTNIITRNQSVVVIEKNALPVAKRIRTKHGRNLTTPLFVEELIAIEEAVKKLGKEQDISMATFIRKTILDQCKKVLGKEDFNQIMANQLNSIKPKKEK
jgi:hypothetical protein